MGIVELRVEFQSFPETLQCIGGRILQLQRSAQAGQLGSAVRPLVRLSEQTFEGGPRGGCVAFFECGFAMSGQGGGVIGIDRQDRVEERERFRPMPEFLSGQAAGERGFAARFRGKGRVVAALEGA